MKTDSLKHISRNLLIIKTTLLFIVKENPGGSRWDERTCERSFGRLYSEPGRRFNEKKLRCGPYDQLAVGNKVWEASSTKERLSFTLMDIEILLYPGSKARKKSKKFICLEKEGEF